MKLSSAHKAQLAKVTRVTLAGAMVVGSVSSAFVAPAQAAQLSSTSMTLADTRPDQANVTYTLSFNPSSTGLVKQINIKFCADSGAWNDACDDPTAAPGVTGASYAAGSATVAGFGNGSGGANTVDGASSASGNVVSIVLATPTGTEATGTPHTITLPGQQNASAAQTYFARIRTYSDTGTTLIDNGQAAFALVSPVVVSGTVLESMTFQVAAVTAGACGAGDNVTATTATATTIPFGNFQSGTPRVGCHTVATATNAAGGYTTKVQTVNPGAAPQGAMCRQTASNCSAVGAANTVTAGNYIADAGLTSTAATWTPATTFGLGVNANGGRAATGAGGFSGAANVFKQVVGTNGVTLATHNSTDTSGASLTYVVYKADVPANQTAGVYQNQLEYISTPTF